MGGEGGEELAITILKKLHNSADQNTFRIFSLF